MGGKVFSSGLHALYTPRMGLSVYNHVKAQSIKKLKDLGFSCVASPIEAPEKNSFGDVDLLACLEGTRFPTNAQLDTSSTSTWALIEQALGSVRSHYEASTGQGKQRVILSKSIAIPWPTGLDLNKNAYIDGPSDNKGDLHANKDGQIQETKAQTDARFIQVDIRLTDTYQQMEWRLFKHNHGDLWNMIGKTIRPFGLTADDVGLQIRIPEMERQQKKKARILLSSDPIKVIDFLGLSRRNGEWEKPFKSMNDLFEYAATCKWFMLWPRDHDAEQKAATCDSTEGSAGKETQEDAKMLKSNDSRRMKQRPAFARWVDEFIPACHAQGRFIVSKPEERTWDSVRDEVRSLAFEAFPGSEAAYNAALVEWNKEKMRIFVKNKLIKEDMCLPPDIGSSLPIPPEREGDINTGRSDIETNWRGVLRSALVKIIIDDDETFDGIEPPKLRDANGILKLGEIKDWIGHNWVAVGRVAWILDHQRNKERMENKGKPAQKRGSNLALADDCG